MKNQYSAITVDEHTVYFCHRCYSSEELDSPNCPCRAKSFLGWVVIGFFVGTPMVMVAIKFVASLF